VPLLKAFGIPLYEGRIKRGNVLGYYLPKREAVRVKKNADIETAAHEIAHLIDDRVFHGFGRRRAVGGPKPERPWISGPEHQVYAKELAGLSYDVTKVYEGFAEFVRHWMTQPEVARQKAPEFFKWWTGFVGKSEYGPALIKAQESMTAWWDQSALDRAISKIGKPTAINEALVPRPDAVRQGVADDLHGILRMERELTGGQIERGPYETARLTRAAYSIAEGAIRFGRIQINPDGSHSYVGKSLEDILGVAGRDTDKMLLYWTGKSAAELYGQGRENLFTRAEIKAMLALETPEYLQAFKDFQEWNSASVDFAERKGAIDPLVRGMWARDWFLPFWRVAATKPTSRGGGVEGALGSIRALRGGTQNVKPILQNIANNTAMLIEMGLKNEARMEIIRLAERERGGGRFLVRVATEVRPAKIPTSEVQRIVLDMLDLGGQKIEDLPPDAAEVVTRMMENLEAAPGLLQFWQRGVPPKGGNLMAALDRGKPIYAEVGDPLLFRAVQALNRPMRHGVIRFAGWFRRLGQDTVTLTPSFMAANISRDTVLAPVLSKHGFRPFLDSAIGMWSRVTRDANYREAIANGVGMSSYLLDEAALRAHVEHFYDRKGIDYRTVIDSPRKVLYGLETLADAFEVATRLGEYRRARQKGVHPRKAAYEAREVSTDFGMRGDSQTLGAMYDTVVFLKAAVNGIDRVYRGVAVDTNRASVAVKIAMIAAASMALYAINRGNPLYEEMEDWDKDGHWHLFVPTQAYYDFVQKNGREPQTPEEAKGLFIHLRYPKIWEVGGVGSIAERSLERTLDGQPKELAGDVFRVTRNLFNFEWVPQVLEPAYEVAINRNRFTDRPIQTDTQLGLPPYQRVGPSTSETLAKLGEASRGLPRSAQVNPVVAEALIRGYLNTWGMYGLTLADAAFFDDRPALRVDQYPVFRRFYEADPNRHTKYETEFYDMLQAATEARRGMRNMDRLNRPDIAGELAATPENAAATQLERQQKQASAIAAEMRQVRHDPSLTKEERRARLDELILERNALFRATVEDVKAGRSAK